jgi:hypothetical protein
MSVVTLRIGPADHGRPMTLDEFLEAEEEPGHRYELAGGVLEVSEVPDADHGQVIDHLREAISLYRRDHRDRIIRIAHSGEVRLIIPELVSGRHADLAIVFRGAPSTRGAAGSPNGSARSSRRARRPASGIMRPSPRNTWP